MIEEKEIEEKEAVLWNEFRCWEAERGVFSVEQGCTWMLESGDFVWRDCQVRGPSLAAVEDMFFSLELGRGELRQNGEEQYIFWPVFPEEGFLFSGENDQGRSQGQLAGMCWFL